MTSAATLGMPTSAKDIFEKLYDDAVSLAFSWSQYQELFADPQDLMVLNDVSPTGFQLIEMALRESMVMRFCRMTDPARVFGKETASFERLLTEIKPPCCDVSFHREIRKQLKATRKRLTPIRETRDMKTAHIPCRKCPVPT
jgi:AbiU2